MTSVQICKPDAGAWSELSWSQVLLAGNDLKLKIKLSLDINTLSDIINTCSPKANLRTFTFDCNGVETTIQNVMLPITAANSSLHGGNEIRTTLPAAEVVSCKLVSKAEDSIVEKCSADSQSFIAGASHRRDSDCFDIRASGAQRGLARGSGNINTIPPEGEFSKTFIQAAGVLCIDATVNDMHSMKRQAQEQSDIFYFSGHGNHANAMLANLAGPSDVIEYWEDIDKAIFAGCAVLDINDYNNHYTGANHTASPGKKWVTTAPNYFLGYNWYAPLDDNLGDSNFTLDIIANYFSSTLPSDVHKWMWANRNKAAASYDAVKSPGQRPWNACALTRGTMGWIYWFWDFNTLDPDGKPMLNYKLESEW